MKPTKKGDAAVRGAVESAIATSKRSGTTSWEDYARSMERKFSHWDSVDIPAPAPSNSSTNGSLHQTSVGNRC